MTERKKRKLTVTAAVLASLERANPGIVFKPLTEETAADFKKVVRARFSPATEWQVDELLTNPLRSAGESAGWIAYEHDAPVCVQGMITRRVYRRQTPYSLLNASMFARMPDASPVSVFGVMWRTHAQSSGMDLWFGNTAIKASRDIEGALVLPRRLLDGSDAWNGHRAALIHPIAALWTRFQAIHPRLPALRWSDWSFPLRDYSRRIDKGRAIERCNEISVSLFGDFWKCILADNEGLITSRAPDDLRWMYGARIASGRVVLLSLKENNEMKGFIILRANGSAAKRWTVIDLIAEKNDESRLEVLMREAVRFLRRETPAMELTIAGFPDWLQPTIAKVFTRRFTNGHNSSSFAVYNHLPDDFLSLRDARNGWFDGPADGDAWM